MNKQYEMVKEFHEKMGQPTRETPKTLEPKRAKERYDFMFEELNEFYDAEHATDQADAMIDLIYLALGTMVEMGVKPEKLFEIVHKANMSKLWEDGKPRVSDQGKIIKPPHFQKPEPKIQAELMKQLDLDRTAE